MPPTTPPAGPAAPSGLPFAPVAPAAPAAPAPSSPPAAPQAAAPTAPAPAADDGDDELAASPWNTSSNLGLSPIGLNRDLLPSAMAGAPPPPEATKGAGRPEAPAEGPSRAPWIIVGVLAVVAIAGAIVAVQVSKRHGAGGQIAIPVGSGAVDDTPAEASASASSSATAAPAYRPAPKPKTYLDDPYADPQPARPRPGGQAPAPASTPAPAKNRLFGTEQ
jgi:hypothetical protein